MGCLSLPLLSQATHLMGGDITYTCLGGDRYLVRLTLYRDCAGVLLSPSIDLQLRSATCNEQFSERLPRIAVQELTPICPSQQGQSSCNGGNVPGVEEHIYEKEITLGACPDWRLYTNICCRNFAITNLQTQNNTRILIETTANLVAAPCNNSPVFSNQPVPYICAGELYQYSNGATDVDGDSLAYELVDPREIPAGSSTGNPEVIDFLAPFTATYPVETTPANAFNFDPLSGQMSFVPASAQQPVLSVMIKEYRDGVLIGTVIRDIQMVVLACSNQSPDLQPPSNVSGGVLNGQTFSVCAGSTLSFDLTASDPDAGQTLTMLNNVATNLPPGASFTQTGSNPVTGTLTFPSTPADTGSYLVSFTVRDNGCPLISQQNVGYNIIVAPSTNYPTQQVLICPTSTSTVPLQSNLPDDGTGTYQWTPATGLTSTSIANPIANIPAGGFITYQVAYVGGSGACPLTEQIQLRPSANLTLSSDSLRICLGDSVPLSANLVQIGAPVPVTYNWDPPAGLSSTTVQHPVASPSSSQTYTVTASTLSCAFDAEVSVEVVEPPALDPIDDAELCSGDTLLLQGSGDHLDDASFAWTPVSGLLSPQSLSTLALPGNSTTYTLRATNACGSDQVSTQLTVYPPLNLSLAVANVTCNGAANGSILAIPNGGNGNPLFSWQPGGSNADSIVNLSPGTYSVVATDAAGCYATDTATITQPTPLTATATLDMVDCFGQSDGSLSLSASGGTPGYRYALDGGAFQSQATFSQLSAGTYQVRVRDANGCEFALPPQTITQPAAPVALSLVSKSNASCNGTLGSIDVAANGGTAPYQYRLGNGPWQPNGQFTGLLPGTYLMRVRDANDCADQLSVDVFEITDPNLSVDSLRPVSCYGGSDGYLMLNAQGGAAPYSFSLDGGPFGPDSVFVNLAAGLHTVVLEDAQVPPCTFTLTVNVPEPDSLIAQNLDVDDVACAGGNDGAIRWRGIGGVRPYRYAQNGGPQQVDSLFTGLVAGTYPLVITDANGCVSTPIAATVDEPAPLQLTGDTEPVRCFGESNGSLAVSAEGGTLPYAFSLDGGALVSDTAFAGLRSGSYRIRLIDAQQCADSLALTIEQPDTLIVDVAALQAVSCFGDSSGVIAVQTQGGTQPYQWALNGAAFADDEQFDGLPSGSYRVIVRDERGCQDALDTVLTEPTPLEADAITTPVSCFGEEDGTAEALARGGTPPYQYQWIDHGSTDRVLAGLEPQALLLEVMDAQGCLTYANTEVIGPSALGLDSSRVQDVACYGEATGEIFVRGGGGEAPYAYAWDDGSRDTLRREVPAGTYFLTLTDSLGCDFRDTFAVAQPDSLFAILVERQAPYCGLANGLLRVSPQGGTPPYTLSWATEPLQIDTVAVNLYAPPGDTIYRLDIVDSLGCLREAEYVLTGEAPPTAAFTNSLGQDSMPLGTGELQWINQSVGASSYQWDLGDGTLSLAINPSHRYEEGGSYLVSLIAFDDRFECPDTAYRPLVLLPPGNLFVPNAFTPNHDGVNETFRVAGQSVQQLELRIYNRWGELIYVQNSLETPWDGYLPSGYPAQEGVYVYVLKAQVLGGTAVEQAGTVTLLR